MQILFLLIQIFGFYGVIKQNKNILVTFIASIFVSFIITWIDYLISDGHSILAAFFIIQALFIYLYLINILNNRYLNNHISNIHYIPMSNEDVYPSTTNQFF